MDRIRVELNKMRYMRWNLSFRDQYMENSFLEEKLSYQREVSLFCNLFIFSFSVLLWASGKDPLYLRQLIFNIIKVPMVMLFLYFRRKAPNRIEIIVIALMFPFFIFVIENAGNELESENTIINSYFNGGFHELFCIYWIILKVCWKKTVIILACLDSFISFRYFDIEANLNNHMGPFLISVANFTFHAVFVYIMEKKERKRFLQVKLKEKSLAFFQRFIQESLTLGVIVVRRSEILFNNHESSRLLGIDGRALKIEDLRLLEIEDFEQNSDINQEKNSENRPFGRVLGHRKSLDNFLKYFPRSSRKNSMQYIGKKSKSGDLNKFQKFIVKVDKIIWKDEFATIITISEDLNAVKLEYLQDFELFKDRVLASVSHQFRTPLNAVMGILESVSETVTDPNIKESLEIAFNSSQRLLSVINDILDFSQINLGKFSLKINQFSIEALLREIAHIFEPEAIKKGLEFKIENRSKIECEFFSNDEGRLKQVLYNLLTNAFKHTTKGFIRVSYEYFKAEKGMKIKFMIEDTGCGIKESMITKLFEFFGKLRERDYKNLNTDGIGFGLAISHKLLSVMNQNEQVIPINVHSVVGEGSVFSFEIKSIRITPLLNQESYDLMGRINEIMEEDHPIESIANYNFSYGKHYRMDTSMGFIPKIKRNKKILIVDDDAVNLIVLSRYLSQTDIEFMTASNGLEALNIIEKEADSGSNFDLILMDCNMPVMDGYEATERIRVLIEKKIIPDIPIIAVTANVLLSDLEKCLESGMTDYLTKPLTKSQLLEKISKHT